MQGHGASLSLALVKASWWMTNGIIAGVHARKRGCTADKKQARQGLGAQKKDFC